MNTEMFPNMPLSARLFVYTSNNCLTPTQLEGFSSSLQAFIESWKAHGAMLDASFKLIANRVLFIVVDEKAQAATGCSLDSMNRHLQDSGYDWFSRTLVLYNTGEGGLDAVWEASNMHEFHSALKRGDLSMDTFVINSTVLSLGEAREKLVQKVSESWHKNML